MCGVYGAELQRHARTTHAMIFTPTNKECITGRIKADTNALLVSIMNDDTATDPQREGITPSMVPTQIRHLDCSQPWESISDLHIFEKQ